MAIKIIFDNTPEGIKEYQFTDDILTPEMRDGFKRLIELNRDAILAACQNTEYKG